MVQLQDSILERLHHHTLFSVLFDKISEANHARILSCFGPRAGVWLITWLVFSTFRLFSPVFSITLCTQLGLPHFSIVGIPWRVCTHPIDPMGIHLLHYSTFMATNALEPMMRFATPSPPLRKMLASTWDESNYMHFLQPHSTSLIDESTLYLPKMAFAP